VSNQSTSDELEGYSCSSSDGTTELKNQIRYDRSTVRNSFAAHGIQYYECVKATQMWFIDIANEIEQLAESSEEEQPKLIAYQSNHLSADLRFTSLVSLNAFAQEDDD
jgi:hypothetical protein